MIRAEEIDYILTPTQKGGTVPDVVVMMTHPEGGCNPHCVSGARLRNDSEQLPCSGDVLCPLFSSPGCHVPATSIFCYSSNALSKICVEDRLSYR